MNDKIMKQIQRALKSKDFNKAASVIDALIARDSVFNHDQYLVISNIYLNVGRTKDSLKAIESARTLQPNSIGAAKQAFWALYADDGLEEAAKVLEILRAEDCDDQSSEDIYNRWELILAEKRGDHRFVVKQIDDGVISLDLDAHRGYDIVTVYIKALCDEFRVDDALTLLSTFPNSTVKASQALSFALAKTLEIKGSVDACLDAYEYLVDRFQSYEAQWNKTLVLLSYGRLAEGWAAHEERWKWKDYPSTHWVFHRPNWCGEDLTGKTILVVNEQGLGDEIMFLSKLPLVDCFNPSRVMIQVTEKIVPLVADWYPQHLVVAAPKDSDLSSVDAYKDVDYCIAMGSLSFIQIKTGKQFEQSFLNARCGKLDRPSIKLISTGMEKDAKICVGISWRSSNFYGKRSSLYLNHLALENIIKSSPPQVKFICLQYRLAEEEKMFLESHPEIFLPPEDLFEDVDMCANYVDACDIVICPPTIIRQLAGITQTPCITWGTDPQWSHLGQEHYPWFPNIKLIKCQRNHDTGTLVDRLKSMINRLPSMFNVS